MNDATMKVFNLGCAHDHSFEGWFGSSEEFDSQLARGLVECPVCADKVIRKLPTAPRLNLGATNAQERAGDPANKPMQQQMQALWFKLARHLRENTEDVGERFAEEARRIHYDEAPKRGIRGVASTQQSEELAAEGIEVFSFPMPAGSNDPLQ